MSRSSFHAHAVPILLLIIASSATCTVTTAAADITACTISAWSTDTDRNGLNIRAGAGSETKVIGQIPIDGEVSITGSKNGWFRIDRAELVDYDSGESTEVFSGDGWVSGRLLGLGLNDFNLHSAPAEGSVVIARLFADIPGGGAAGSDSFIVTRLLTCQGNWVEVEGTFLDTPLRGWSTRTCSNQVTTCP